MATTEKHHYIPQEKLKEKYKSRIDWIKGYTKAIAADTQTKISAEMKGNKTVQFVITGRSGGVGKALQSIKEEFDVSEMASLHQKKPKWKATYLDDDSHKRLLKEEKNPYLLTKESLRKFNILTGAIELRQFACGPCNHPWWTYVPITKPVSRCNNCKVRYDALDRVKEFGIGRYICIPCDHTFYARCEATEKQICFECHKLTGPPYINPRFKPHSEPYRVRKYRSDEDAPSILKVINASTPHESTGSTCSSFVTQDMGPDIPVEVEIGHRLASKDQYKSDEGDEVSRTTPRPGFIGVSHVDDDKDDDDDDDDSTTGEVGDHSSLESELESVDLESESGHDEETRRRTRASDSSDSDSTDEVDKTSESSNKISDDSGISTWSNAGTGSNSGTVSMKSLMAASCDYKADYPGVAFSKNAAKMKMTSDGGMVEGEGIKLHIPPGAIKDDDEVDVSLQACLGGPFYLPGDLVFASPVYLIEPPFAFHKNVTLTINLFAEFDDCSELRFITSPTKPELSESDDNLWNFKIYGSPRLKFEANRSSGEIDLRHFCFAAFASKVQKKLKYCISLYCPSSFCPPESHVIVSAMIHHEVYSKNLKRFIDNRYKSENFEIQSTLFNFSAENSVSLVLPEGVVSRQGYKISSIVSPCRIRKEEVDYPNQHKKRAIRDIALYPPRIILRITQGDETGRILKFPLKLEGIKEDKTYNIMLHPFIARRSSQESNSSSSSTGSSSESPSNSIGRASSYSSQTSGYSSQDSQPQESMSPQASGYSSQDSQPQESMSPQASGYSSQDSQPQESTSPQASGYSSQDSHPQENVLNQRPRFSSLFNHLCRISHKWDIIAVNLEISNEKIEEINAERGDLKGKLRRTLSTWKNRNPAQYTWATIIAALEQPSLDEKSLADEIRELFF